MRSIFADLRFCFYGCVPSSILTTFNTVNIRGLSPQMSLYLSNCNQQRLKFIIITHSTFHKFESKTRAAVNFNKGVYLYFLLRASSTHMHILYKDWRGLQRVSSPLNCNNCIVFSLLQYWNCFECTIDKLTYVVNCGRWWWTNFN